MHRSCDGCMWVGDCDGVKKCRDFSPVDDDAYSEMIDEYIELAREEYRTAFLEYIGEEIFS